MRCDRCVNEIRYHHLNHWSIFGGGYKSGAKSIMKSLVAKYGDSDGEDNG
jgi:hypothetical protein